MQTMRWKQGECKIGVESYIQGVPIKCIHSLNDYNTNIYFNTEYAMPRMQEMKKGMKKE